MKISEIQQKILTEVGIKTSVKKGSGSMKNYLILSPMFQNGSYPKFPFDWRRDFLKKFPDTDPITIAINGTQIHIHKTAISGEPVKYQKERKPKTIDPDKPTKGWGSKNSQLRLDKAAARYGGKIRQGKDIVRFY